MINECVVQRFQHDFKRHQQAKNEVTAQFQEKGYVVTKPEDVNKDDGTAIGPSSKYNYFPHSVKEAGAETQWNQPAPFNPMEENHMWISNFKNAITDQENKPRARDLSFDGWLRAKFGTSKVDKAVKKMLFVEWMIDSYSHGTETTEEDDNPYNRSFQKFNLNSKGRSCNL